jgi:hypothetical protein
VAAGFSFVIAIVIWFFLVPHPSQLGINVEEIEEEDAILEAAA